MSDLYGPKCKTHGLMIHDDQGRHTEQFKLWCRKCDDLTANQVAHGMRQLEFTCARHAQAGDDSWPPNYAEFIGHCTASWQTAAHKPFERLALPDKSAQERAKVAGRKAIDEMKSLFGGAA